MKICLIANDLDSVLNFRHDLLLELKRLEHEVTICVPYKGPDDVERVSRFGAAYRKISLKRTSTNPLNDLKVLFEIGSLLKELRPDLVFCFTAKPIIFGSIAAWWVKVPRCISMVTGLGYVFTGNSVKHRVIRALVCLLYKLCFKINSAVFFLNPDDLALFTQFKLIDPSRAVLIPGEGINLETFPNTPLPEKLSFLLIARLLKDKGIFEYVEAAKTLKRTYPDIAFKLIGPYDLNPTAISPKEVGHWQDTGLIQYLGETKDVRPFIADSSVYILPSYREGTPRSVLEAMSMGRPIITTDVPGCRETVENGRNGFLVPVKDPQALSTAMEKFIKDPDLIPKMGRYSREIAEKKFDVRAVNDRILGTLLQV